MKIRLLLFSMVIAISFSCDFKAKEYECNEEELGKYISVKEKPESVKFEMFKLNQDVSRIGPSDYCLVAVLTYPKEVFLKVKNEILKEKQPIEVNFIRIKDKRIWFPESVADEFVLKGDLYYTIKTKSYKADYFYKAPYIHGFCFFTEKNEVFLCLYAL